MTAPWPWPGDTALDRSRRIANSLLALLPDGEAARHVTTAHRYGETWLGPHLLTVTPDQAVTTRHAAQILSESEHTIRRWACLPHPVQHGRALLPRAGMRGREQTYLVSNLLEAARLAPRRGGRGAA